MHQPYNALMVCLQCSTRSNVIDACTGTGNGLTLRHYLDREALTGFDDRSGSMALWFAAEIERLRQESPVL